MNTAISVNTISKSFGQNKALKGISFEVKENELFGFIGPDGAGKTTLFRILTTLMVPDSGKASICGLDVVKDYKTIRQMLGYMPGRFSLYQDLTVEENLTFFASVFSTTINENYDLIKDIYSHIEPFKTRPAGKLSGGMKQKLALSCALIHKPKVLVLDEPTTGVDAVSRKEFWQMLKNLQHKGITIVVSTPYMDEATLCDRVALITEGSIMAIDTPNTITKSYKDALYGISASDMYRLKNDLLAFPGCKSAHLFGQLVHYSPISEKQDNDELFQYLQQKGHADAQVQRVNAGIEDCFIQLMSQETWKK